MYLFYGTPCSIAYRLYNLAVHWPIVQFSCKLTNCTIQLYTDQLSNSAVHWATVQFSCTLSLWFNQELTAPCLHLPAYQLSNTVKFHEKLPHCWALLELSYIIVVSINSILSNSESTKLLTNWPFLWSFTHLTFFQCR